MQHIAQGWLVYVLTKSALYLGLISFLQSCPMLIFTIFAGVMADKYSRKRILILTQILSLIPAILIGVLIHLNLVNIWHVAGASIILGIAGAFDMPARQAFISEVVGKEMLTSAIAMQSMSFNIARIIGPILAGFIVTHLNFYICFYLNALSFIPLIIILSNLSIKSLNSISEEVSVKHFLKEGYLFLINNKQILYTIFAVGTFTIFGISFIPILPIIADELLKTGAKGYGLLVSSIGVGSLTAATLIAIRKKDIDDKLSRIFKASLIIPIGLIGVGFSESFFITMSFAFLLGFAFVNFFTVSNSLIQHQTEQRMRGRIMSFFAFVFLGFTPIGNFLIGWLVEKLNIQTVISIYSILCTVSSILFFKILPKLKH